MRFVRTLVDRATDVAARLQSEEGQAMVEYALLISLVAVVSVGMVRIFGLEISSLYSKINSVIPVP